MRTLLLILINVVFVFSSSATWKQHFEELDKNKDHSLEKSELLHFLHQQSVPSTEKTARAVLSDYDKDKDGFLTLDELKEYVKGDDDLYNLNFTDQAFILADQDHDKKLSVTEIITLLKPKDGSELRKLQVMSAFDHIDVNKDGNITISEYYDFDPDISEEEQEYFTKNIDLNNDGIVDREEFLAVEMKSTGYETDWVDEIFKKFDVDKDGKLSNKEFEINYKDIKLIFEDHRSQDEDNEYSDDQEDEDETDDDEHEHEDL